GTAHVVASGPNRMSTKNKAHWIGTVPETDALKRLAESGIHVLCVRVADYGCGQSALVRALMEGVPTIATDIPVLAEYLPQFGVVSVPPGDPLAIGDAVNRWRSNPDLWRHAREDAFKFAMRFEHAPFARRMALIATELD
ncbi:MAG: glycosyltransferase, partial [Armatimonadaceae bacterium]